MQIRGSCKDLKATTGAQTLALMYMPLLLKIYVNGTNWLQYITICKSDLSAYLCVDSSSCSTIVAVVTLNSLIAFWVIFIFLPIWKNELILLSPLRLELINCLARSRCNCWVGIHR